MKKMKFKTIALLLVATLLSINTNIFAQNGKNMQQGEKKIICTIPNLTQEQQTKIEKLKTAHMQEMINYKTQLAEKKAHKNTLMVAKNVDLKSVNKVIDEMSAIRAEMQKTGAKHHNDVRNLLTDEQKVFFDSHYLQGKRKGMKQGRHEKGMRAGNHNMNRQGSGMNK